MNPPFKFESRLVYRQNPHPILKVEKKIESCEPGSRLCPLEKKPKMELQPPKKSEICQNMSILIPYSLCHQFDCWSCSSQMNIRIWDSTST